MSLVRGFCQEWEMPDDAAKDLESAFCNLHRRTEWKIFEECIDCYVRNPMFDHAPIFEKIEGLQESLAIHPYTLDLLYLICLVPHLKKLYQSKNLPLDIFYDSVSDLKWKAIECKKVYDIWGIFVGWWTIGFFKCRRFAIGRLQFNLKLFQKPYTFSGIHVNEGDQYLDTHIPSSGPLIKEDCRCSYRRAADFFRQNFAGKPIIFGCHSWLLSPNNRAILPPTSRILTFAADYEILKVETDPQNSNLWRIFDTFTLPDDPETLPQTNSLQKAFVAWLKKGNTIDMAFGAFRYPL